MHRRPKPDNYRRKGDPTKSVLRDSTDPSSGQLVRNPGPREPDSFSSYPREAERKFPVRGGGKYWEEIDLPNLPSGQMERFADPKPVQPSMRTAAEIRLAKRQYANNLSNDTGHFLPDVGRPEKVEVKHQRKSMQWDRTRGLDDKDVDDYAESYRARNGLPAYPRMFTGDYRGYYPDTDCSGAFPK